MLQFDRSGPYYWEVYVEIYRSKSHQMVQTSSLDYCPITKNSPLPTYELTIVFSTCQLISPQILYLVNKSIFILSNQMQKMRENAYSLYENTHVLQGYLCRYVLCHGLVCTNMLIRDRVINHQLFSFTANVYHTQVLYRENQIIYICMIYMPKISIS